MKSYFLEGVASVEGAVTALRRILPGQESPWVLRTQAGEPIAYFNVIESGAELACPAVQVDVSGRHWKRSGLVLSNIEELRSSVGGFISSDE
jgi:hypothetical protein